MSRVTQHHPQRELDAPKLDTSLAQRGAQHSQSRAQIEALSVEPPIYSPSADADESSPESTPTTMIPTQRSVSAGGAPALPAKSSLRASRVLDSLLKLTPGEQPPFTTQSAPHDVYLSSEEDASSSADDFSDFEFDSGSDESRSSSKRRGSHEDTARVVSVVYSGKPSMIHQYGDKMREAREKQYQEYLAEAALEQVEAAKLRKLREEKDMEESSSEGYSLNASGILNPISDPEEYVNFKISSKKVVIFSKRTCPFCAKAKQAMSSFRLSSDEYEVIELDDYPGKTGNNIQKILEGITGAHSVPRVFINGKCIGGGDDTVSALRDGRLERWLREANAI